MKENQKDQQVATNPGSQQDQNRQVKDGKPSKDSSTMVEDAQTTTEKEHREDKHQHDSKTPVGELNRTVEKANNQKSDASTGMENKEQRPDSKNTNSEKGL